MNSSPQPSILAIIPAHNEADHIAAVVRAAGQYLPVYVVDDGSSDLTGEIATAAGATVFRQEPNQGKGAALRTGFRQALHDGCSAVITLDADGQHDPLEIPRFLEKHSLSQADLIIGERDFRQMPFARRFANTTGGILFSWALGQKVSDNQSGYRLISRRLIEILLDSKEHGFEFEVEMVVLCVRNQLQMECVPIRTIYADEKSHIRPLQHVSNFLRVTWRTHQSMRQNQD